jgi:hypothetical protein
MRLMVYLGTKGDTKFDAVCIAVTAPMEKDTIETIKIELIPILSISVDTKGRYVRNRSGLRTRFTMKRINLPRFFTFRIRGHWGQVQRYLV